MGHQCGAPAIFAAGVGYQRSLRPAFKAFPTGHMQSQTRHPDSHVRPPGQCPGRSTGPVAPVGWPETNQSLQAAARHSSGSGSVAQRDNRKQAGRSTMKAAHGQLQLSGARAGPGGALRLRAGAIGWVAGARLNPLPLIGRSRSKVDLERCRSAEGAMRPILVVPVEVPRNRAPQVGAVEGHEDFPKQLALQRQDEALGHRDAAALAHRPESRGDAASPAPALEDVPELHALVGDSVLRRGSNASNRSIQHASHRLRGRLRRKDGEAYGAAGEVIDDDGDPPREGLGRRGAIGRPGGRGAGGIRRWAHSESRASARIPSGEGALPWYCSGLSGAQRGSHFDNPARGLEGALAAHLRGGILTPLPQTGVGFSRSSIPSNGGSAAGYGIPRGSSWRTPGGAKPLRDMTTSSRPPTSRILIYIRLSMCLMALKERTRSDHERC